MSSPSQLFSCTNALSILQSPINTSPSKLHWSFSKDSRFKKPTFQQQWVLSSCDNFYQIPGLEKNKNRKTGFGYGKKTDLEFNKNPEHIVPSPDTYNISSFVQNNAKNQKGFSPLFSREEVSPTSYIELEPMKMPGPGRYEEYRYNQTPKWSMRPKVSEELFPITTTKIVPGPGTYQNQEALQKHLTGRYCLSNHRTTKAKVFNPSTSKRFYKSTSEVPGPGIYEPQNHLSNEGKYVLSKNVSNGKRTFMQGRRISFTDLNARRSFTPGPGSYRPISDFGHYDSKKERQLRLSQSQLIERTKNASSKTDRTRATKPEDN